MSSEIEAQKSVASSAVEVIDADRMEESNIRIIAYSNEVPVKNDSDTETEDESENKVEKIGSDGQNNEDQESDQLVAHPKKTVNNKESSPKHDTNAAKKKRVKLEEIKNFDILLPNDKNCDGVREAKKDFYNGFISYRKLIDRLRPVFMERDAPDHKTKISQWLVGKISERGGRFLKEDGDGTAGNCTVLSLKESLECTITAFEDKKEWTAIVSFISGVEQKNTANNRPVEGTNPLNMPQLAGTIANASSGRDAVINNTIAQTSCVPPLKKLKSNAGDSLPLHNAMSSNLSTNPDQSAMKNILTEAENHGASLQLQKILRERQLIRTELTENQEILLMRQERLSQLEGEFRMFQARQMFLPSERWLAEKILRQEEIFENRELFGIQQQRCRRLQTLLELNERQMFEQQTLLGREKLKMEIVQSKGNPRIENERSIPIKDNIGLQNGLGKPKGVGAAIDPARALMEAEINKQQQHTAARFAQNQQLAFQAQLKRQVALEQTLTMEKVLDQKIAMEQEIQYRQAMEHAMRRRQAMQHAMETRQLMMHRGDIAQAMPETALLDSNPNSSSNDIPKPSPDVTESMSAGIRTTEASVSQNKKVNKVSEEKSNGGDTAGVQEDDGDDDCGDDDDDDYSIVI